MERRKFIKTLSTGLAASAAGCGHFVREKEKDPLENRPSLREALGLAPQQPQRVALQNTAPPQVLIKDHTKEIAARKEKSRNFKTTFEDDIFIDPDKIKILRSLNTKLWKARTHIGYGHFNLLDFDAFAKICKSASNLKELTSQEKEFFEQMFHEDAKRYGFYGDKPLDSMTAVINKKDAVKVPRTGHYLYRGEPYNLYLKIRKEVGPSIVLTSGIRSVVKQMHLFLTKAIKVDGNLSKASRSLAPPGHSYHGIGDFDVGKVGFGLRNFSDQFAQTREYQKLINSGYIQIRYTKDNPFGVRYEPWHIKVIG